MTNTEFSFHQVGSFTREGLSTIQIFRGDVPLGWAEYSVDEGAYYGRVNAEPNVRIEGMSGTTKEIAQRLVDLEGNGKREYPCQGKWYSGDVLPHVLDDDGYFVMWSPVTVLGELPTGGRTYYRIEFQGGEFYAHPNDMRFDED